MAAELPSEMRAVGIAEPGGPEVLRIERRPVPMPAAGQVLVRVAYAGVNRPDVLQRLGRYPPPPGAPDVPGLEIAGEVVAGEAEWVGRSVCALVSGGGYAEYCAAPAEQCLPVSEGLPLAEGAARPETLFTLCHTVNSVSGSAAASASGRVSGTGRHCSAGATQYSA